MNNEPINQAATPLCTLKQKNKTDAGQVHSEQPTQQQISPPLFHPSTSAAFVSNFSGAPMPTSPAFNAKPSQLTNTYNETLYDPQDAIIQFSPPPQSAKETQLHSSRFQDTASMPQSIIDISESLTRHSRTPEAQLHGTQYDLNFRTQLLFGKRQTEATKTRLLNTSAQCFQPLSMPPIELNSN